MKFSDTLIIFIIIIISMCMVISAVYHIYKFFHHPYKEPIIIPNLRMFPPQ